MKEPRARTADDLQERGRDARTSTARYIKYRDEGNRIAELAGIDTVQGRIRVPPQITMKDGQERVDDVDCSTFLEVRWQGVHGPNGDVYESYFDHYRRVNGVMYAFEINVGVKGAPPNQRILLDRVELGDPVDDARFGRP